MVSRRNFIKQLGIATAGLSLDPLGKLTASAAPAKPKQPATKEKVKVAFIGIGNRGEQDVEEFEKTGMIDVVALCDVDLDGKQCQKVLAKYPNAKRFRDFREMFEKYSNQFDAVIAAVPDLIHFPIAMTALSYGKHIYLEKPMTRTFLEAELLMAQAKKHPELVTQVGNQGHSEGNYFQFKAWKEAGIIKDVSKVVAHMNSPRRWHPWDSNIYKFPDAQPLPPGMDWDTWLGACQWHDFNEKYHQGNWRCWYDFGMGALGDWGAHLLDTAHEFLDLGLPYEVSLKYQKGHNDYFYPYSSTILFRFGARENMPPCDIYWYDGIDNLPPLPANFGASEYNPNVPATNQGNTPKVNLNPGKEIYTPDLIFKGGSHGSTLSMIPSAKAEEMKSKLPEVPKSPSNHFANFLLACQGKEKTRSPFEINGVLSEVFCLGVIAQRLNTQLFFDPHTKRFTNNEFANAMLSGMPPRKGWEFLYK
jgi:predicted dehydrogenase